MTDNKEDAEDVTQDVFIKVFNSINSFREDSKFYLSDYKMTPSEISRRLNEMPYSYLKYKNPKEVIREMSFS